MEPDKKKKLNKWINIFLLIAVIVVVLLMIFKSNFRYYIDRYNSARYQDPEQILTGNELSSDDTEKVKDELEKLQEKVNLTLYRPEDNCGICDSSGNLYEKISQLNSNLFYEEIYSAPDNAEHIDRFELDQRPVLDISSQSDNSKAVRIYGVPAGYEFGTLIKAIIFIGTNDNLVDESIKAELDSISQPKSVQIYVTRSCMFCSPMAELAIRFALSSDKINVDIIQAEDFHRSSQNYQEITGFPATVIDGRFRQLGLMNEQAFLDLLKS